MSAVNSDNVVVSFNDQIYKCASSRNAGRAAIKALNSYFGKALTDEIDVKEFEKLTVKKLASISGMGVKSFMLICQAYKEYKA